MAISLTVLVLLIATLQREVSGNFIGKLRGQILTLAHKDVLPITKPGEMIKVQFSPVIQNIHVRDINRHTATIELFGWHKYQYTVAGYAWNPEEHEGQTIIKLPKRDIWNPDWRLWNGLDVTFGEDVDSYAEIHSDGRVFSLPPAKDTIKCSINPDKPGSYECTMKYGSWVYHAEELETDFFETTPDNIYLGNLGWPLEIPADYDISNISQKKNSHKYDCCPEQYVDLEYTFTVTRKALPGTGTCGSSVLGQLCQNPKK